MSPPVRHATVGDDVYVHAGLVEVTDTSARRVGDRSCLRHADAEHTAARARVAGTDADEDADCAGTHQVQRRGVRRAPADDHRKIELADELLQVEGLALGIVRHMFGRDDRSLDDQHVELGVEHELRVLLDPLRGERCAASTPPGLDLADALRNQLGLDRLVVQLLHPTRCLLGRQRRDFLEHCVGVLVARPDTFEVQARQAAQLADLDRGRRRHDAVHRGRHHRQLELVRVDLPRDVDVFGISGTPARHDRDVVESVRTSSRLSDPDLNFHGPSGYSAVMPGNKKHTAADRRNVRPGPRQHLRLRTRDE